MTKYKNHIRFLSGQKLDSSFVVVQKTQKWIKIWQKCQPAKGFDFILGDSLNVFALLGYLEVYSHITAGEKLGLSLSD